MLDTYTVAFFGHRDFNSHFRVEKILDEIIEDLLRKYEYVEFLIGRSGEFDRYAASRVRVAKREYRDDNSSLVLVLHIKMRKSKRIIKTTLIIMMK